MYEERGRDPVTLIALAISLAAIVGVLVAVPSLLPTQLRELVGLGPDRIADPAAAGPGGSYVFFGHQPGDKGDPVGYDPCMRIQVRINPDGAPDGSIDLVRDVIGEVEALTGLAFSYDGTTTERPDWDGESVPVVMGRPLGKPVLVSWATEDEVPELKGNVAGVGGSVALPDHGRIRYVTGAVTLDAGVYQDLMKNEDGYLEARAIVLHEFGHLVGLAHVNDSAELMNEDNLGLLEFGRGDRTGLAKVGAVPCA